MQRRWWSRRMEDAFRSVLDWPPCRGGQRGFAQVRFLWLIDQTYLETKPTLRAACPNRGPNSDTRYRQVAPGRPGAPTDPNVRNSRIRLLRTWARYVSDETAHAPCGSRPLTSWAGFATCCSFVEMFIGTESHASFPPTVHAPTPLFAPPGPSGWFPFRPITPEVTRSPRFLGNPYAHATSLGPRRGQRTRTPGDIPLRFGHVVIAFHYPGSVGPHHMGDFGAYPFAVALTVPATQNSLSGGGPQPYRSGTFTRGRIKRFQLLHSSSSSKLSWRNRVTHPGLI